MPPVTVELCSSCRDRADDPIPPTSTEVEEIFKELLSRVVGACYHQAEKQKVIEQVEKAEAIATQAITTLISEAELRGRIDELKRVPNPAYISGAKRVEPMRDYKYRRVNDLLEQQSQLTASKEGDAC